MVLTQKQVFIYAGIGLAASGIATMFLIYQEMIVPDTSSRENSPDGSKPAFTMQEVHANLKLVMHNHTRLELQSSGQPIELPAEIGIAPELWHDHSLDKFGPSDGLLAPIHTHDASGTIHIESVINRNYTLGEFLAIWGVDQGRMLKVTKSDGSEIDNYIDYFLGRNESLVMELRA